MKYFWLAFLLLLPGMASAQSRETTPPACTVAQLAASECAPAIQGTRVRITNGNAAVDTNCATGTGSADIICEYDGSNWVTAPLLETSSVTGAHLVAGAVSLNDKAEAPIDFFFCGQGPNATTENFWSPVSNHPPDGGIWTIGGTLCDGNDSTTIGTADQPIDGIGEFNINVKWLHCTFLDGVGGVNDILTFVLYDDTSATTLSCTITLDGVAETKACDAAPSAVAIAARSALAVGIVANTDDDVSADDGFCMVSGVLTNNN